MKDKKNNFATYQIYSYVEELFTELAVLVSPEITNITNKPHHGLERGELDSLLNELFQKHHLVALQKNRGLFTPSVKEVEAALLEDRTIEKRIGNTFYGITTGALESFIHLKTEFKS